jgi:hypothetical protein
MIDILLIFFSYLFLGQLVIKNDQGVHLTIVTGKLEEFGILNLITYVGSMIQLCC